MANQTKIEWTGRTWNPVTGCDQISPGCDRCYAKRFSERFRGVAEHAFETGFDLTLRPARLEQPLLWRKPSMIFVNSMSDLFHKDIPREFLDRVFSTMERATWHIFQILTKRSSRLLAYIQERYGDGPAPRHIWLGVSVEDALRKGRIEHLRSANAAVRFLSLEPLLGPLGRLDLSDIDWVIVGGESGPGFRPMHIAWVTEIRDQCVELGVPFFFKQWGGLRPKAGGRELEGRTWSEFPAGSPSFGENQ